MRWDELFADLEGQLAAEEAADLAVEVAERARAEDAQVGWVDRLRAAEGSRLDLDVRGVGTLSGQVAGVGSDCLLLADGAARVLVPQAAVLGVRGLGPVVLPATAVGAVGSRLGLAAALRRLALDRQPVQLTDVAGLRRTGTIDRALADHLDLAEHPADEARRAAAVRTVRAVPYAALASVRPLS